MDEKARKVYLKIIFLRITDIETVTENFSANVFIQARWREKKLDGHKGQDVKLSEYWSPKLLVQNLESSVLDDSWKEIKFENNEAFILEKRRIKGTFKERQELQDFPFDFQDISVAVTSEYTCDEVMLFEDENEVSSLTVTCFTGDHEWEIRDFVVFEKKEISKDVSDSFQSATFPLMKLKPSARRKFGFFIWNIVLVMTFISCLPLAIFAVNRKLTENRTFLGFLLILIGVTFRFITNKVLPKISYLTTLDKYILVCMIFMFLCTIWHGILSQLEISDDTEGTADLWGFVSLVILYTLYHVIFISVILIKYLLRRHAIITKERAYQEKAVKLLGNTWIKAHRQ